MLIGSELEDEREKHGTCALGQGNILTAILFSASESEVLSLSLSLSLSLPCTSGWRGYHLGIVLVVTVTAPSFLRGATGGGAEWCVTRERDAVREKERDTERERQIYI